MPSLKKLETARGLYRANSSFASNLDAEALNSLFCGETLMISTVTVQDPLQHSISSAGSQPLRTVQLLQHTDFEGAASQLTDLFTRFMESDFDVLTKDSDFAKSGTGESAEEEFELARPREESEFSRPRISRSTLKKCSRMNTDTDSVELSGRVKFNTDKQNIAISWFPAEGVKSDVGEIRLFQWQPSRSPENTTASSVYDVLETLELKQLHIQSVYFHPDSFVIVVLKTVSPFGASSNVSEYASGMIVSHGSDLWDSPHSLETHLIHPDTGAVERSLTHF